jgi:acyl-CoA synthetase (NDP forming)
VVVVDTFGQADREAVEAAGLALFDDFDRAAAAIAKYGRWRQGQGLARPQGATITPGRRWPAASFRDEALSEVEAKAQLAAFGVPVAQARLARGEAEARAAAEAIGGPLVLKLVSPDVQHKSEHGFVRLGIEGPDAAAACYRDMTERAARTPGVRVDGVTVEPQLVGGVELLCGCTRDPVFGWMMTVGLGGVFTEVMADVSHRLLPVDATEADAMLRELKGFRLLQGYRGAPPADVGAAAQAIAALSDAALNADARVREIEINPLIVLPEGRGAFAADGLVLLDRGEPAEQKVVA